MQIIVFRFYTNFANCASSSSYLLSDAGTQVRASFTVATTTSDVLMKSIIALPLFSLCPIITTPSPHHIPSTLDGHRQGDAHVPASFTFIPVHDCPILARDCLMLAHDSPNRAGVDKSPDISPFMVMLGPACGDVHDTRTFFVGVAPEPHI